MARLMVCRVCLERKAEKKGKVRFPSDLCDNCVEDLERFSTMCYRWSVIPPTQEYPYQNQNYGVFQPRFEADRLIGIDDPEYVIFLDLISRADGGRRRVRMTEREKYLLEPGYHLENPRRPGESWYLVEMNRYNGFASVMRFWTRWWRGHPEGKTATLVIDQNSRRFSSIKAIRSMLWYISLLDAKRMTDVYPSVVLPHLPKEEAEALAVNFAMSARVLLRLE